MIKTLKEITDVLAEHFEPDEVDSLTERLQDGGRLTTDVGGTLYHFRDARDGYEVFSAWDGWKSAQTT